MTGTFNLSASDSARVGNMVGVVHGNATFYHVGEGASPTEKYRVGLNYLRGNVPRKAEELIHEAAVHGHRGAEAAYYWVLALFSGQTFDHLDDADFDKINQAIRMAYDDRRAVADSWRSALDVVIRLVQCLAIEIDDTAEDGSSFDEIMANYQKLPEARRDEVRRHLNMILVGGVQDQIDELDEKAVRQQRLAGERVKRSPQFFLPPQAKPVLRPLVLRGTATWREMLPGAIMMAVGTGLSLWLTAEHSVIAAGLILVLWGGGGYLAVRLGVARIRLTAVRDSEAPSWDTRDDSVSALLRALIDTHFRQVKPDGIAEKTWMSETGKLRASIGRRLTAQYGWRNSKFAPFDIDWLVSWHASRAADRWRESRSVSVPAAEPLSVPLRTTLAYGGGLVAIGAGAVVALETLSGWFVPLGLIVLAIGALGIRSMVLNGRAVIGDAELIRRDEDRRQQELREEEEAFERWHTNRPDRPSDAEMARWLDYDKAHIKHLAMRQFGLRNRDLIGHVLLTQADDLCMRARVLYGPPRYSRYQIRLFLLTTRGIREVNVHLNFITGAVFNERRTVFQYGSITSAEVGEVSVHVDGDERQIKRVENSSRARSENNKLTFAHALHLTLNNGRSTFVLIENFDQGLLDRVREDASYLEELARDAAGVTGALRILESIAAEGAAWVDEERRRRDRRLRHYRQRQRRRAAELDGVPYLDLSPQLPDGRSPVTVTIAFNDRITAADLGGLAALMTEDHTFVDSGGRVMTGKRACIDAWRGLLHVFPGYRNVFISITAEGDTVTATGHSECDVAQLAGPARWTATIRDGKVARWQVSSDAR
ncbi:nuclear transport factor 2 family protein [Asanoa sp. NPDC049518]|uniref:nuclear transport factor 2 family protein n=1 Tax=unclassified Asanoa TaxID=2685164 RepID=UPI0034290D8F